MNRNQSPLVHTLFLKNPLGNISLNYSLNRAGALVAIGRRFESCRLDHLKPIHTSESSNLLFYCLLSHIAKGELEGELGSNYFCLALHTGDQKKL